MKVLNLRCANGHGFEGWFSSEDDYLQQNGGGRLQCPLCGDGVVTRLPSAPRLNLSGARASGSGQPASAKVQVPVPVLAAVPTTAAGAAEPTVPDDVQASWLQAVRDLMARTEDVGSNFAEEARRIHYGEVPTRGIRGQATPDERASLLDEGIETLAIPVPVALKGPLQ